MSPPVEFSPEVQVEINDAHAWYEQRMSGLGPAFLDEVQGLLGAIALMPSRFGFALGDIRVGMLDRFPYAIYFRVLPNRIRILAVFHTARDPSAWQSRT